MVVSSNFLNQSQLSGIEDIATVVPLRNRSTWNPDTEVFDVNPSKNAYDKVIAD